jgi:hypothetical protein
MEVSGAVSFGSIAQAGKGSASFQAQAKPTGEAAEGPHGAGGDGDNDGDDLGGKGQIVNTRA